jgi:hypothetical protein
LRGRGLLAYPFEVKDDALLHDIMGIDGYIHAVALVLRVRPAGLVWSDAPPNRGHVHYLVVLCCLSVHLCCVVFCVVFCIVLDVCGVLCCVASRCCNIDVLFSVCL